MTTAAASSVVLDIPVTVDWSDDGRAVRIVDQRALPTSVVWRELRTRAEAEDAIVTLAVRGAPAIGVTAALMLALLAEQATATTAERAEVLARLDADAAALRATRPTAVNLPWAIDRMLACAQRHGESATDLAAALREEATRIRDEDRAMCDAIGRHGAALFADGDTVLTHCNAGALATAGIGTALAPIYTAVAQGRRLSVIADETRPLWQGARLTAWELAQAGIPVRVCTDGMAAALMAAGAVQRVIVGADRICANGDVVNKIGTYAVAIAARFHGIPFYVAAPWSTVDPATPRGDAVVIEARHRDEVVRPAGRVIVPEGVPVENPAFDVTPAALVTAIITDRGVHAAPFDFSANA
ncbi:MAG: S-methyl-5-thioribose-1-phosphate isomerase [Gemmatimonadaceae bacterium]|nr:S-methyl-5-thioribose-1-phosphate isomerase [Gemmatimonadaceae bacterium]